MVSVKSLISAGAAILFSTAAYAADLGAPPPPMAYQPPAPVGGWYLRGDIGIGTDTSNLVYEQNPLNSSNFALDHASMADTDFIGGGIGYDFNSWLRFDATAEYRSRTQVNAFGQYTYLGGTFGDQYQGYLKSVVVLANGYVDLGTWWCLTPFVGAGIGGAWNQMADLTDIGIGTSGAGTGENSSSWSPAWALYAGVAYNVTDDFKMEFTYRYLNYGSVTDSINCIGGCNPDSYAWKSLSSNDFMLGFRWLLAPPAPALPISTRG
jgi:opacity protein-like surface antigen